MPNLLDLKQTHFVLWNPFYKVKIPQLIIGQFQPGNPPTLINDFIFDLEAVAGVTDLWALEAKKCGLTDGQVYYYWFMVKDSDPHKAGLQNLAQHPAIWATDPTALTVDWRLQSPRLPPPFSEDDRGPASVIKYEGGFLRECDPDGGIPEWNNDPGPVNLPLNNQLVIYELPTRWARLSVTENVEIDVGTFRDVMALIVPEIPPANFRGTVAVDIRHAHLSELGINALQLLPSADSWQDREWGYQTSNYFAADYNLGFPKGNSNPTASTDFVRLIIVCHQAGIRFFDDMVMAFGVRDPYQHINFMDFHVNDQQVPTDPELKTSNGASRSDFGGAPWKYAYLTAKSVYDPISGADQHLFPARQYMKTHLTRWLDNFRLDGIRIDSIPYIKNWDFVKEFNIMARSLWNARGGAAGLAGNALNGRFLVIGEELSEPLQLIDGGYVDALWHERFQSLVRSAILGETENNQPDFATTIFKMIDCRRLNFSDGAQVINYITSHDVAGPRKERLFNFLNYVFPGNQEMIARRVKLAFACLLTAVGIPMILAGEEFADQHDIPVMDDPKQLDPVNFDRREEPWRKEIFKYVSRLVKFRTGYEALGLNDTDFIHTDFTEGKRVVVWRRGRPGSDIQAIVVANFSDWGTFDPGNPTSNYNVPNWPATPVGRSWQEVSQNRSVPSEWVAREPIYPWEAKVYALV
jgi:1,4-alpha-glucan branching enzyme